MNGLRSQLTAPPVLTGRQSRGDSKDCCRPLYIIEKRYAVEVD